MDWHQQSHKLRPGIVSASCQEELKLDRTIPGDAPFQYAASRMNNHWRCDNDRIEATDLQGNITRIKN